ncbi:PREDICTED: ATP synthase subunit g, mitochondrial-like [Ceratosolen solmsi marchali]|uniref:ATP synthase subunit g n=1 Tax=Ceratosolen solmsi marchali TaxID=326594 RepID=A0AAJ6YL22_9HYME|nr:PREDICTED: ATP synthase subunit g, mitochondrial-like [Ceratosolen solmsi marchali]
MSNIFKLFGTVKDTAKAAIPHLRLIQRYALVELVPPSPRDIPAIRYGINKLIDSAKSGSFKQLTVKEAWLNTLVAVEIYCWFFIGECIGKRNLIGYKV